VLQAAVASAAVGPLYRCCDKTYTPRQGLSGSVKINKVAAFSPDGPSLGCVRLTDSPAELLLRCASSWAAKVARFGTGRSAAIQVLARIRSWRRYRDRGRGITAR
jgi:hypothetical protein